MNRNNQIAPCSTGPGSVACLCLCSSCAWNQMHKGNMRWAELLVFVLVIIGFVFAITVTSWLCYICNDHFLSFYFMISSVGIHILWNHSFRLVILVCFWVQVTFWKRGAANLKLMSYTSQAQACAIESLLWDWSGSERGETTVSFCWCYYHTVLLIPPWIMLICFR